MSMFVKEKTDGTIKGRTVADGRPQRKDAIKEDATSHAVLTEVVSLTAAIEASEKRDTSAVGTPNTFVQMHMTGPRAMMKFCGALAESLVKVAPELYSKRTANENRKMVLCAEPLKALCGCLILASSFHRKLLKDSEAIGFVTNSHDPCTSNKAVGGEQLMVT